MIQHTGEGALTAQPVHAGERIAALDVARGIALLGILTVNVHYFGWPLGDVLGTHTPPKDVGGIEYAAWYYLRTFGEGKFFTIFSTLFGAGLTIQWLRATERGLGFGGLAVRRLGFLMLLGLCHGLLLWYGDILFVYAWCGLLLLVPLHFKWSARTQVVVAVVLMALGCMLWGGMSMLQGFGSRAAHQAQHNTQPQEAVAHSPTPSGDNAAVPAEVTATSGTAETPFGRLLEHWQSGRGTGSPDDPVWRDNEVMAYRHGPWLQSFLFRGVTWLSMIFMVLFGFGLGVVTMFLIGSAIIKSDVIRKGSDRFFRIAAIVGMGTGVPLSVLATSLLGHSNAWLREFVANALYLPAGAAVALGIIACVVLWTRSGKAAGLARLIATTGRFGLTNYLLQTVICTTIFYHWGFAKFGSLGGPALLGIALGVYAVQLVLSAVADRYLQYGPMEWLWRSVTYWRFQPFLRRASERAR
ncbi:MAG TPA: DUF418 domain-containing protein [Phycisphaerales bacterium]|nr:DUF418 domain-containing protein [Phycisphaerales bacterium]